MRGEIGKMEVLLAERIIPSVCSGKQGDLPPVVQKEARDAREVAVANC